MSADEGGLVVSRLVECCVAHRMSLSSEMCRLLLLADDDDDDA